MLIDMVFAVLLLSAYLDTQDAAKQLSKETKKGHPVTGSQFKYR
jgi:hypothetical protein